VREVTSCRRLLLYFLRFLDIYDNSLKGALMDNYLEELKRLQNGTCRRKQN